MASETSTLICDLGSSILRFGTPEDTEPKVQISSYDQRPFNGFRTIEPLTPSAGTAALVCNGAVQRWDDLEGLLRRSVLPQLRIDPQSSQVLLTESHLQTARSRTEAIEVFMETFRVGAFRSELASVLSLQALNRASGVYLHCGEGPLRVEVLAEGYLLSHLSQSLPVSGQTLAAHFAAMLQPRGLYFNMATDRYLLQDLMLRGGFVSGDILKERMLYRCTTCHTQTVSAFDGRAVTLYNERFEALEPLFSPDLLGVECKGAAELVFDAIQGAPVDIRPALYQSIVLEGGLSCFPGFAFRLREEVKKLYVQKILQGDSARQKKVSIRVEAPPGRRHLAFIGAAIGCEMQKANSDFWVSQKDYQEKGAFCLLHPQ